MTPTENEPPVEPKPESREPQAAETEPKSGEAEPTPEIREDFEPRESAETVAELLNEWAEEYTSKETPSDRKQELAWQMVKMEIALQASGLDRNQVKIRESAPGVLGFYRIDTHEVAITAEGLGDVSHYDEILVHEAQHKAGFHDEGVAQLATRRKVANARRSIYEGEQRKIETTFNVPDVLELYDIKNPAELIDAFLDVEWRDRWKAEWRSKFDERPFASNDRKRHRLFRSVLNEPAERIEQSVKKALPDLYEKLKGQGFDFAKAQQARFDELYERDIEEIKKAA